MRRICRLFAILKTDSFQSSLPRRGQAARPTVNLQILHQYQQRITDKKTFSQSLFSKGPFLCKKAIPANIFKLRIREIRTGFNGYFPVTQSFKSGNYQTESEWVQAFFVNILSYDLPVFFVGIQNIDGYCAVGIVVPNLNVIDSGAVCLDKRSCKLKTFFVVKLTLSVAGIKIQITARSNKPVHLFYRFNNVGITNMGKGITRAHNKTELFIKITAQFSEVALRKRHAKSLFRCFLFCFSEH